VRRGRPLHIVQEATRPVDTACLKMDCVKEMKLSIKVKPNPQLVALSTIFRLLLLRKVVVCVICAIRDAAPLVTSISLRRVICRYWCGYQLTPPVVYKTGCRTYGDAQWQTKSHYYKLVAGLTKAENVPHSHHCLQEPRAIADDLTEGDVLQNTGQRCH
jgi:hypothetical protein